MVEREPESVSVGGGSPGEAPVISVVCASNDPAMLERMLLASLRQQTVRWELRVVDAAREGHRSCAAALNVGAADAASTPWLMFVHQDVGFDDPQFLEHALRMMSALPDLAAAGPIGASEQPREGRQRVVNRLLFGDKRTLIQGVPIDHPTRVQTLDELMIFAPRSAFSRLKFDEVACPDWHLYGVDYCLSAARLGLKTYVLPLLANHFSGGTLSAGYYLTLQRVLAKHRDHIRTISTTSESWPTSIPSRLQRPWHYAKVAVRAARRSLR